MGFLVRTLAVTYRDGFHIKPHRHHWGQLIYAAAGVMRVQAGGMLWIVPARVGGTWRTPQGDLVLTQKFQKFSGTLHGEPVEGRLRGTEISFTAGATTYRGQVDGLIMRVSATVDGKPIEWTARPLPGR